MFTELLEGVFAGSSFLSFGPEFASLQGLGFGKVLFHGAGESGGHVQGLVVCCSDFFWAVFLKIIIGYREEL